jgi:hypothetical protein
MYKKKGDCKMNVVQPDDDILNRKVQLMTIDGSLYTEAFGENPPRFTSHEESYTIKVFFLLTESIGVLIS